MQGLIAQFAEHYFSPLLKSLNKKETALFLAQLVIVVHSHRHNKSDDFLAVDNLDFDTFRDTMYKYSKKAQEKFFLQSYFTFLFIWFT